MAHAVGDKVTLLNPNNLADPIKVVMCPRAHVCHVLDGPAYMVNYPWELNGGQHFHFGPIAHDRLKAGWHR